MINLEISESYVDDELRKTQEKLLSTQLEQIDGRVVNQVFVAERLRMMFRRAKEEGIFTTIQKIVGYPLDILRDLTIPPSNEESYDRNKLAMMPLTVPFSFCFLMGIIGNSLTVYDPEEIEEAR